MCLLIVILFVYERNHCLHTLQLRTTINLLKASTARELSYGRVKGFLHHRLRHMDSEPTDTATHGTVVNNTRWLLCSREGGTPVPTEQEAWRTAEPRWTFWREVSR
jgi:hypothetical protein